MKTPNAEFLDCITIHRYHDVPFHPKVWTRHYLPSWRDILSYHVLFFKRTFGHIWSLNILRKYTNLNTVLHIVGQHKDKVVKENDCTLKWHVPQSNEVHIYKSSPLCLSHVHLHFVLNVCLLYIWNVFEPVSFSLQ